MITKLKRRIIAINVVSMGLVLLIAITLLFSISYGHISAERENRLGFALKYDPADDEPFDENRIFDRIALVCYDTQQNKVVAKYFGADFDKEINLDRFVPEIIALKKTKGMLHAHIAFMKSEDGNIVRIALNDYAATGGNLITYVWITLGVLALALLCYFFISWFLARMAIRPVEDSWKKQKQFVADASHELKTPLSVIMANTDILVSHKEETVESQMQWVQNTQEESRRMADLVGDLLFLAKNDDGVQVSKEDVNLSDCIQAAVLGYDAIFYENGKEFRYDIQSDLHVFGNAGQFKQLVTILLDNANKYSLDKGNIRLNLSATGKHVQLVVANDCEQLSDEQLSHLFDRFYTGDPSRNKSNGGNGLGLAIAQTVCQTHDGVLRANCIGNRIAFTATFPIRRNKSVR